MTTSAFCSAATMWSAKYRLQMEKTDIYEELLADVYRARMSTRRHLKKEK
jgi:hypothetical protein